MRHPVTLIRGDGTGPELAAVTQSVLDATGVAFEWHPVEAGVDVMEKLGTPLPDAVRLQPFPRVGCRAELGAEQAGRAKDVTLGQHPDEPVTIDNGEMAKANQIHESARNPQAVVRRDCRHRRAHQVPHCHGHLLSGLQFAAPFERHLSPTLSGW